MKIYNQNINIESSKINKDITICIIADIHNTKYSSMHIWKNLIKKVKNLNPDYIIIPGDIIYIADDLLSNKNKAKLEYLLTELANIAPIYISLGNHDLKEGKTLKIEDTLSYFHDLEKRINFHLLDDEIIHLENLDIIGINPPFKSYYLKYKDKWINYLIEAIKKCMNQRKINPSHFVLLTIHSAELMFLLEEYIENNDKENLKEIALFLNSIDLMISGHAHGGLVPKLWRKFKIVKGDWGIIASEGDTFKESTLRKYDKCRGIHNIFNGKLIISEGITKWCQPNPLFGLIDLICAKDITTIKLIKK